MKREELKEKIIEISNSEFPLVDFFNDIDWLDDRHFNTEKAYEDIEKIYNVFMFYINKCNKLEKENEELRKAVKSWNENGGKILRENIKLKQAIKVLKEKRVDLYELQFSFSLNEYNIVARGSGFDELTQKQYELLKEVFESVGDECE